MGLGHYASPVREKQRAMFICLLLAAVTLALFWPVTHFDFINYDDPDYVINNQAIQHGLTAPALTWAFTTYHASNWHPVTWISHLLDCSIFGLHPGGHHLTNLLLHTANAILLFLILWKITGEEWRSALVAALFAWHPLHVESVAWISERKDVLSTFFSLLTIAAYGRYAGDLKSQISNLKFYIAALFCFILALLSKPMAVTLPVVLLLLDFWPLRRSMTWHLLLEKIPFFALAALACIPTLRAQHEANSVVSMGILPLPVRMANALVSGVLYLWKTIWPVDLAVPYPYSHLWTFWPAAGAGLLLALISVVAILRLRKQPYLIVGWLWFLVTLTPVIGLVQVGFQSMADRYTYLPLIGIFIMLAWAIPLDWARWPRPGLVFGAVTGGALMFLLVATAVQLQYWRDSVALFSHTVSVTPDNILAEYNLAEALAWQGDEADAVLHYQKALAIHPNPVETHYNSQIQAHYNLGLIYLKQQKWTEAEEQFRACLEENPNMDHARLALTVALAKGKSAPHPQ